MNRKENQVFTLTIRTIREGRVVSLLLQLQFCRIIIINILGYTFQNRIHIFLLLFHNIFEH